MDLFNAESIRHLLLFAPPFIISLTFHEFAHAWAADRLGDHTARYLGRMTMDPMAHISWIGTVVFPAIAVLTGAPLFGWANPVPVDMRNFRRPRAGMALVAAAGPASNILLAVVATACIALVLRYADLAGGIRAAGIIGASVEMLLMAVQLNLFLAFFNLIPMPPLDGSRIIQGLVSSKLADDIDRFAMYGQYILLFLFFAGVLRILAMPVYALMGLLFHIFGIPLL